MLSACTVERAILQLLQGHYYHKEYLGTWLGNCMRRPSPPAERRPLHLQDGVPSIAMQHLRKPCICDVGTPRQTKTTWHHICLTLQPFQCPNCKTAQRASCALRMLRRLLARQCGLFPWCAWHPNPYSRLLIISHTTSCTQGQHPTKDVCPLSLPPLPLRALPVGIK